MELLKDARQEREELTGRRRSGWYDMVIPCHTKHWLGS